MKKYMPFHNRFFVFFIMIILSNALFNGCYSFYETTVIDDPKLKVYKIETQNNKFVDFRESKLGYATISNNIIINTKENGEKEIFQLLDVKTIYTEKFDYLNTSLIVVGILGAIIFVSIAMAPAIILDKAM